MSDFAVNATRNLGDGMSYIQGTVVTHPSLLWWGATSRFVAREGAGVAWSRHQGVFWLTDGQQIHGLTDPGLSRRPLELWIVEAGVMCRDHSQTWHVQGLNAHHCLTWDQIKAGVLLQVGDRISLWLEWLSEGETPAYAWGDDSSPSDPSWRGAAHAIDQVQNPMGLVGECGSGKQYFARQWLRRSGSSGQSMLAFNPREWCALSRRRPESASEWVGRFAVKVAAVSVQSSAVLYLDAMTGMPVAHQRALVEWAKCVAQDRPVFLAWDVDPVQPGGAWRQALATLPHVMSFRPLRQRRREIPRLIAEIAQQRHDPNLPHDMRPWAMPDFFSTLMRHAWPGNVSQLRAVIHGLRFSRQTPTRWTVPPAVWRILDDPSGMVDAELTPSNL